MTPRQTTILNAFEQRLFQTLNSITQEWHKSLCHLAAQPCGVEYNVMPQISQALASSALDENAHYHLHLILEAWREANYAAVKREIRDIFPIIYRGCNALYATFGEMDDEQAQQFEANVNAKYAALEQLISTEIDKLSAAAATAEKSRKYRAAIRTKSERGVFGAAQEPLAPAGTLVILASEEASYPYAGDIGRLVEDLYAEHDVSVDWARPAKTYFFAGDDRKEIGKLHDEPFIGERITVVPAKNLYILKAQKLNLSEWRRNPRASLPYGMWTQEDGTEVLFNRSYRPMWKRTPEGEVSKTSGWVDEIVKVQHYYDDWTPPYRSDATRIKCQAVLDAWGVTPEMRFEPGSTVAAKLKPYLVKTGINTTGAFNSSDSTTEKPEPENRLRPILDL
jgi:hypothetical protein